MTRRRTPTVAVVGLGLVGGSIARGLTRAGWRVLGVDRAGPLKAARAARAIARGFTALSDAARAADVVVLAAPPQANRRILRALAVLDPRPAVVTDVGSVKAPICREARRLGLGGFVGGHPMAGRERSGFAASSPDLFRGRTWVLVHAPEAAPQARVVARMARALGARVRRLSAEEHDRAVAFVSHLPQLVAWALLDAARRDGVAGRLLDVAGPGFADMTRLAGSPRRLWDGILSENAAEVTRALRALRSLLPRQATIARPLASPRASGENRFKRTKGGHQ
jgi:prephenate dehydrogenase